MSEVWNENAAFDLVDNLIVYYTHVVNVVPILAVKRRTLRRRAWKLGLKAVPSESIVSRDAFNKKVHLMSSYK